MSGFLYVGTHTSSAYITHDVHSRIRIGTSEPGIKLRYTSEKQYHRADVSVQHRDVQVCGPFARLARTSANC